MRGGAWCERIEETVGVAGGGKNWQVRGGDGEMETR